MKGTRCLSIPVLTLGVFALSTPWARAALFGPPSFYGPVYFEPRALTIGDLDGDGALDVATANLSNSSIAVLLNTNEPAPVWGPASSAQAAALGLEASGTSGTFNHPALLVLPAMAILLLRMYRRRR